MACRHRRRGASGSTRSGDQDRPRGGAAGFRAHAQQGRQPRVLGRIHLCRLGDAYRPGVGSGLGRRARRSRWALVRRGGRYAGDPASRHYRNRWPDDGGRAAMVRRHGGACCRCSGQAAVHAPSAGLHLRRAGITPAEHGSRGARRHERGQLARPDRQRPVPVAHDEDGHRSRAPRAAHRPARA
ncbi:hypothetical protein D9M72_453200 [compost metagenome]